MEGLGARRIDEFMEKGHVVLRGCFDPAFAMGWVAKAQKRLDGSPRDPQTWYNRRGMLKAESSVMVKDFAPRAWEAIGELAGSSERLLEGDGLTWTDCFVVQFPDERPGSWLPPSSSYQGNWHMDGDEAPRYLDSSDVGLLCMVLWSEVKPRGGGTFIACDSVAKVARYLSTRPRGARKQDLPVSEMISECRKFLELTGKPGDVFLMHPFMLHAESVNASARPRFITAKSIALRKSPVFNRPRDSDHSPVERAVLRALGVKRFKFRRAAGVC